LGVHVKYVNEARTHITETSNSLQISLLLLNKSNISIFYCYFQHVRDFVFLGRQMKYFIFLVIYLEAYKEVVLV